MKVAEPRRKVKSEPQNLEVVTDVFKDTTRTISRSRKGAQVVGEPFVTVKSIPGTKSAGVSKLAPATKQAPAPKPEEAAKPTPAPKPSRLVSLDAFRGLTVILMLIVNNIALDNMTPDAFTHGGWNQSLRLADYVFPWFLLCVGLSIPFSFAAFKKKELPSWRLDLKIIGRGAGLIALGCIVNASISRQIEFTLGVLQLIGIAYLIAAFLYELPMLRRGILATVMLVGYGLALKFIQVPGLPVGTFGENANLIDHINRTYLVMYNLDGLTSAIPTAALMIYGTLVGDALANRSLNHIQRLFVMVGAGATMTVAGIVVNLAIPYNKPVWTPSYILLTGGVGLLALAVFYIFTDAVKWNKWVLPLVVLGSNAILAYVLPVFAKVMVFGMWTVNTPKGKISLQEAFLDSLIDRMGRLAGGWVYTSFYIACVWLILLVFYRRKTFLRV